MGFDQNRLASAASFPASFHSAEGYVKAVHFDADGVWLDIVLYDGRDTPLSRVRLGTLYAGQGWGMYFPVDVDDRVTVLVPDSGAGHAIVVGVAWSKSDQPPGDVEAHPRDPIIVVRENASIRIVTLGTGNIILDPRGSGKVLVGGETGLDEVALATPTNARLTALETQHYHVCSTGITSGPSVVHPDYLAAFPPTSGLIPNPAHLDPGHVHDTPEPMYASAAGGAGGGIGATKLSAK